MHTLLNPYLHFTDNCQEAMEYYKTVFGGTLEMTNYLDGGMSQSADDEKLIMHAQLKADNGITFMASDGREGSLDSAAVPIHMSLSGNNTDELTAYFIKLSDGGNVREPLVKAPWGDTFGMVTDRFDIEWMVNISGN